MRLHEGGVGATAYAEALELYLAIAVSRWTDFSSTISTWNATNENIRGTFAQQAIQMTYDFVEASPLAERPSVMSCADSIAAAIERLRPVGSGTVHQRDASLAPLPRGIVITDPPYYDNIGYSGLSDYFYVWLRHMLSKMYPDELSTLATPKSAELVAATTARDSVEDADRAFEAGLIASFSRAKESQVPNYPMVVLYAFKQEEASAEGLSSTGWETMLEALMQSGWMIVGTWPIRTERETRRIALEANTLASSIALVCRPRPASHPLATRKDFVAALREGLPHAVSLLQALAIAPVDLAQCAIGPGMAIFSRYPRVVEADGATMSVRTALELINQVLDEAVAGSDADFDADTRWATTWFEDCAMGEGDFGRAEQLSKSRNTSVSGLAHAGIIAQRPGKVRLVAREELAGDWNPSSDVRLTVWEITQHLIRRLETDGEGAAAVLLRQVGSGLGETAKELAYRLYLISDRKGWAKEATSYNALVAAWPELTRLAAAGNPWPSADGNTLFSE